MRRFQLDAQRARKKRTEESRRRKDGRLRDDGWRADGGDESCRRRGAVAAVVQRKPARVTYLPCG